MNLPFILASSSPRRRELLASLGVEFTIHKPAINEDQNAGEPPLNYVRRLSAEKAAAVAQQIMMPAIILAADTIVVCDGTILGKPSDSDEARSMLKTLRGRNHRVCTSVTIMILEAAGEVDSQIITELTCSDVTMRNYTDAEIDAYIMTGDPFDKAGGYAIQHPVFAPVAQVEGSSTNVVGLPLETLSRMFIQLGLQVQN